MIYKCMIWLQVAIFVVIKMFYFSRNHFRCYAALINFYMALKDYVQEEMWRSNSCEPSDVPEGTFTELCAKFFEIFLLRSRYVKYRTMFT